MELHESVGIITGASSGIGAAVAKELSAAGMQLVLVARRQDRLEAVSKKLASEHTMVIGDITDSAMASRIVDAAVNKFDRLDFLFNNAGVMHLSNLNDKIDVDSICYMVRVNVEALYRLTFAALDHMRGEDAGHIINVSSTLGTKVAPTTGAYAGTKHAVEAFSEDLRMQVAGTGVKVEVVEPGLVETELQDHFPQHPAKALGIKKMAEPMDIARAVRFMLEQPEHVTVPRLMMKPQQQSA